MDIEPRAGSRIRVALKGGVWTLVEYRELYSALMRLPEPSTIPGTPALPLTVSRTDTAIRIQIGRETENVPVETVLTELGNLR